jgi:hypothetical protein
LYKYLSKNGSHESKPVDILVVLMQPRCQPEMFPVCPSFTKKLAQARVVPWIHSVGNYTSIVSFVSRFSIEAALYKYRTEYRGVVGLVFCIPGMLLPSRVMTTASSSNDREQAAETT